jgi:hypothetical protein
MKTFYRFEVNQSLLKVGEWRGMPAATSAPTTTARATTTTTECNRVTSKDPLRNSAGSQVNDLQWKFIKKTFLIKGAPCSRIEGRVSLFFLIELATENTRSSVSSFS